ncbi:MAG: hypothetical protein PHX51_01375 [Clostridia bacterium]|nr:hypothetical protein [Clostridia bacterium]
MTNPSLYPKFKNQSQFIGCDNQGTSASQLPNCSLKINTQSTSFSVSCCPSNTDLRLILRKTKRKCDCDLGKSCKI